MTRSEGRHRAAYFLLATIWQSVIQASSTGAQAQARPTQEVTANGCTRAGENARFAQATGGLVPCLAFEPLSTPEGDETATPLFSHSEQATSSALVSSTEHLLSFNSTSSYVSGNPTTSTLLQGAEQVTSASSTEQAHTMTNGTLLRNGTTNKTSAQNSTTNVPFAPSTASFTQDSDGTTNATMLPAALQTVTYTTTICLSAART